MPLAGYRWLVRKSLVVMGDRDSVVLALSAGAYVGTGSGYYSAEAVSVGAARYVA